MFDVLNRACGQKTNNFIRAHINSIGKVEFLLDFVAAYKAFITKESMAGGLRGAGVIPHCSEAVISELGINYGRRHQKNMFSPTPIFGFLKPLPTRQKPFVDLRL